MYKDFRYINAGENEFYRWGKKAQEYAKKALEEHNGYYSMPADFGNYWTIGTSEGKFGTYAKFENTFFSVNSNGYVYVKAGTEKGNMFVKMVQKLVSDMYEKCHPYMEEN